MQKESSRQTCLLTSPSRRSRSQWQRVLQQSLNLLNAATRGGSSSSRTSARCLSGDAPPTYDACCWGGARRKKQALESNVPEVQALRSSCHHVRPKSDWTPYRGKDSTMVYPSSGGAEYTADLAFAIAVALSWRAVRNGKAKLNVPRAPIVQEAGNRVGWADMPPQVMRSWVVAATAVRLGLAPPAKQPGAWFPIEDTAVVTCWRRHVTANNPPGTAVYVGQTAAAKVLRLSGPLPLCLDSTAPQQNVSQNTCYGSAPRRC